MSAINISNFTIEPVYYGMNATEFFSRKLTISECKTACLVNHIEFNYWGVYYIIMPLIICLLIYIVHLAMNSRIEGRMYLTPAVPFMVILALLVIFLYWFVHVKDAYLAVLSP